MDKVLLQEAIKLNKRTKRKKWWYKLVNMMAVMVVFCTTYALILPAITMEKNLVCGLQEHKHRNDCYMVASDSDAQSSLMCEIEEHIHDESCLAADEADEPQELPELQEPSEPQELLKPQDEKIDSNLSKKPLFELEIATDSNGLKKPSLKLESLNGSSIKKKPLLKLEKVTGSNVTKITSSNAVKVTDSNSKKTTPSNAEKATASNAKKLSDGGVLYYQGKDFSVAVSYDADAKIPENVELDVREIMPGTEEYEMYYKQALQALAAETVETYVYTASNANARDPEEDVLKTEESVLFARFFDISFVYEGNVIEPEASVEIQIQYDQPIETPEEKEGVAVHFADEGIEVLNAEIQGSSEEEADLFTFKQDSFSVTGTVLLAKAVKYQVWLDGTLGGLMSFSGSNNTRYEVSSGTLVLPETWKSPTRYEYVLRGWYDVVDKIYYPVNSEDDVSVQVPITKNTVFYADWEPASYAIGQNNADTVRTLDTSEFVTIDVFDYNVLFNTLSTSVNANITSTSHSETWSEASNTLNFLFNDWDSGGKITRANNMSRNNSTYNVVVENILTDESMELIDLLFNPDKKVVGKNYVGPANYMFQYMDDPDDEYYGYYYYDSDRNAASYYRDEKDPAKSRFYVYNYLERTSDAGTGNGADFMPLNSPYSNKNGLNVQVGSDGMYVYESKTGSGNVSSNFHLGMKTNIHFYLPNDVGHEDAYGNPGNLDTTGKEMIFQFAGDDDVWVFVDGELVLDLGGIHGVESGTINFSTGEVTNGVSNTNIRAIRDENGAIVSGIGEGGHNLTIYYLERGSSQSNCKMYFNLAPRYSLELLKQDYHTRDALDGVEFKIFTDCTNCFKGLCEIGPDGHCTLDECECMTVIGLTGACEMDADGNCATEECRCKTNIGIEHPIRPAKLWNNHEEAKRDQFDEHTASRFTVTNGKLESFGLVAGKTYYIAESVPPEGYPGTDDLIRLTLNDHGADISELTVLVGSDDTRTQGYEIVAHSLDDSKQMVYLALTNQRLIPDTESTQHVRVKKKWVLLDDDQTAIPDSITVHLTKNGDPYSHSMVLNEENGWTYTWTGLPADGSDYDVTEDQVPGFTNIAPVSTFALREPDRTYIENWLEVAALEDGVTFLLKTENGYLAQENGSLSVVSVDTDTEGKLKPKENVMWEVSAYEDGFKISNAGYYLTLDGSSFKAKTEGNQTLYYDGTGLFAMSGGKLYYLGNISRGSASAVSGAEKIRLIKQELIAEDVKEIVLVNYQLDEEEMTFLNVEKVWAETNEAYWEREVTIHLLADGVDTGQKLVLNNSGDWKGRFEGLPIGPAYSVVEDPVPMYSAKYSDVTEIPAEEKVVWETKDKLEENNIYCFVNGSYALTMTKSSYSYSIRGTEFVEGTPNENQQWKLVSGKLQNVATGRYLVYSSSRLSQTDKLNNASNVSIVDKKLQIGTRYLTLNGTSASTTSQKNSGTSLVMYLGTKVATAVGYSVTVTNTYGAHILPQTGGIGISWFRLCGFLLMAAAVWIYSWRVLKKWKNRGL